MQEGAGPESPIRPRRGQIVAWHSVETENLPIILDGHKYLLAREDGEILAGATDEDVGFDVGITEQAQTELTGFARRWCPGLLMGEPDTQWAGLRPQGDESGPRVGAHDTVRGLFFNTGHYRHGIVCAPGAAARLAECCHQIVIKGTHSNLKSPIICVSHYPRLPEFPSHIGLQERPDGFVTSRT